MNDIYAMRRANGDWFVFEDHDRLRVPLFHSSHDALMARLRNFGMLLFKPVVVDARLLKEIAPVGAGNVDFCLVKDPFARLSRGRLVEPGQLALLMGKPEEDVSTTCVSGWVEGQSPPRNGNGLHGAVGSSRTQSEWWN